MSAELTKTFFTRNLPIIGGLLVVALIIGELFFPRPANEGGSDANSVSSVSAVGERIRPVVTLDDILGSPDADTTASAGAVAQSPEKLYQGGCMACHASGVAGAPKVGDNAAWSDRAAGGLDALVTSATNGKGAMPPKGGSSYSDDELRSVVKYMLAQSGL